MIPILRCDVGGARALGPGVPEYGEVGAVEVVEAALAQPLEHVLLHRFPGDAQEGADQRRPERLCVDIDAVTADGWNLDCASVPSTRKSSESVPTKAHEDLSPRARSRAQICVGWGLPGIQSIARRRRSWFRRALPLGQFAAGRQPPDRVALAERHGNTVDRGLPVRAQLLIILEEDVDGYAAELVVWESDGRQLRPDPRGHEVVVERNNRDVPRNVEARVRQGLVGAEGQRGR